MGSCSKLSFLFTSLGHKRYVNFSYLVKLHQIFLWCLQFGFFKKNHNIHCYSNVDCCCSFLWIFLYWLLEFKCCSLRKVIWENKHFRIMHPISKFSTKRKFMNTFKRKIIWKKIYSYKNFMKIFDIKKNQIFFY